MILHWGSAHFGVLVVPANTKQLTATSDHGSVAFLTLDEISGVVRRIQKRETEAEHVLYTRLVTQFRGLFAKWWDWHEVEDGLHSVFLVTVDAIRNNKLREPERLPAFVKSIAIRQIFKRARSAEHRLKHNEDVSELPIPDAGYDLEADVLRAERLTILTRELKKLPVLDRDILTRFYLRGQAKDEICSDLRLTDTQFRVRKSRAKAKLMAAVKDVAAPPKRISCAKELPIHSS